MVSHAELSSLAKKGKVPLDDQTSSLLGTHEIVREVHYFINSESEESLQIQQGNYLLAHLPGGVFVVSGSMIILFALLCKSLVSCYFDKGSGYMYAIRQNFLLHEATRQEKLDEIKVAIICEIADDRKKICKVKLTLVSGELIDLGSFNDNHRTVDAIRQYLS